MSKKDKGKKTKKVKRVIKKTKKVSTKKKKWVSITASRPYDRKPLGDAYVVTPDDKVGLKMSASHNAITGEHNRQNLQVKFMISKVVNNSLKADLVGAYMLHTSTRKMVRKNRDKLDLSFMVKTKDDCKVRIKIIASTRNHSTGVILSKLHKKIIINATKIASDNDFVTFATMILQRRVQQGLKEALKKTYPVAICDIRSFELVLGKGELPPSPKTVTPKVVAKREDSTIEKKVVKKKVTKKVVEKTPVSTPKEEVLAEV